LLINLENRFPGGSFFGPLVNVSGLERMGRERCNAGSIGRRKVIKTMILTLILVMGGLIMAWAGDEPPTVESDKAAIAPV
jgi:hypothetical protein